MNHYQNRLLRAIPGGAHTYSRGFDQFSSNTPSILDKGSGAYVFDPEGNRYLDYGMALRAITLGYSDETVNHAAFQQILKGNNLTRPSLVELEAAELLIDLIPSAEMVKFAKNGSNVTTAAIKLARAYTGKKYVCIPRQHPFFSFDDWFIGTTLLTKGIPPEHASNTLLFDYGDLASLERLFLEKEGQIAAVMLEPSTAVTPCPSICDVELSYTSPCKDCHHNNDNFLLSVQRLCKKFNSLFILDEMITGFRWNLRGAQYYFGVEPDLSTFGKAMANGFSLSALVGRRDVMELGSISKDGQERTFLLSSTHGAEMSSLGAFVETVSKYKQLDVCNHLWSYGENLRKLFVSLASKHGLEDHFVLSGPPIALSYGFLDNNFQSCNSLRTLFQQELVKSNVIMPWISPSYSHTSVELSITYDAVDKAFGVLKKALESSVHNFLDGSVVKPVFRKYN